jgi:MarR family transcriptional regulator, lower aerobic nicotinate degradation pathway regulator
MVAADPRRPPAAPPTAEALALADALAELSFLVHGTLAKLAASHDVTMIQARLLGVLRDRMPTMQELSKMLALDKSSVTGLVDRAERKGIVARVAASEDRRVTRVHLTSRGRRIVAAVELAFEAGIMELVASIPVVERRRLSAIASHVVERYWSRR